MRPHPGVIEDPDGEMVYRFPYSRAAVELLSDRLGISGATDTVGVRLLWHRGKTIRPLFETTPLRPIGQVALGDQTFPLFFSTHSRKGRERIAIAGRRKTGRSPRQALRFHAIVQGRSDRFTWTWRLGATAPALEELQSAEKPVQRVTLALPFSTVARTLALPGLENGMAVHCGDLTATIVVPPQERQPVLQSSPQGVSLTLEDADFSGSGQTLSWEIWFGQARTDAEVRDQLLRHLADAALRAQAPDPDPAAFLTDLAERAGKELVADSRIEKRGVDRHVFKAGPKQVGIGPGIDAALAGVVLLGRARMSGDDAYRRRARLLAYGIPAFQINDEESAHWAAMWDAQQDKKEYVDVSGGSTLSLVTAARASRGLHLLHEHFGVDLLTRTAISTAQWLLLKTDRDGMAVAERFEVTGQPVDGGSPWVIGEAVLALVETFRVTNNETFLKAALRSIQGIRERLESSRLSPVDASTEHLASMIEGILLASREYESESMIALAQQLVPALMARRRADGAFVDPDESVSVLDASLSGIRATLALARVDPDPQWPIAALRALRAARREADARWDSLTIAQLTGLSAHATGLLLTMAARAKNCVADRDRLSVTRGWQTFAPDHSTNEFIQVESDTPVDHLALVCPVSHQVLVMVIAPPSVEQVTIIKNQRVPMVRNLLDGDMDIKARLLPLGDGVDANIGVFLADT